MPSSQTESYFQKLNEYIKWQTGRIRQLETRVDALSKEVEALRKERGVHIDRIEYKFDQLKVETLEGTLNIGLSPSGLGKDSVEDASAGGQTIQTNTARSETFERIQVQIYDYLMQTAPSELAGLEKRYNVTLGEEFRQFVVGDLQTQATPRIEYYLEKIYSPMDIKQISPEQEKTIADLVIRDIRQAMDEYMLKSQGGDINEAASGEQGNNDRRH